MNFVEYEIGEICWQRFYRSADNVVPVRRVNHLPDMPMHFLNQHGLQRRGRPKGFLHCPAASLVSASQTADLSTQVSKRVLIQLRLPLAWCSMPWYSILVHTLP